MVLFLIICLPSLSVSRLLLEEWSEWSGGEGRNWFATTRMASYVCGGSGVPAGSVVGEVT